MAWYPDAIRREIPPGGNDPRIIPVGCILHVAVSGADSLFPYFDGPSGGIESTWYIRYDGTVEQYRDSNYEADANGDGNSWRGSDGRLYGLHSIETAGFEHGEWTPAQIRSIKKLLVWDAQTHGWPLQVIPRWNGSGVGYHVMFGAPGPYTNVRGKTCPGPDRVRQFHDIITPWLNGGADLEDDMSPRDWGNADKDVVGDIFESRLRFPTIVTAANGDKVNMVHAINLLMRQNRAILDFQGGSDAATVIAKLDEAAAADAARDQAILQAIEAIESGDADGALAKLRDLLDAALADES